MPARCPGTRGPERLASHDEPEGSRGHSLIVPVRQVAVMVRPQTAERPVQGVGSSIVNGATGALANRAVAAGGQMT